MEYRTLEINSISGKDLNRVNLITKMAVYAVISISGGDKKSMQTMKTPVDRDGDTNPTWNFPLKFTVDEAALRQNLLTLDFKLVCERALGDKDIGEVNVPIKELLESPASIAVVNYGKQQRFVSYQVRKPNGQPKGQITFSYKFVDEIAPLPPSVPGAAKLDDEPVTAYPAVGPSFAYPPPSPGGVYPPYTIDQGTGQYPPPPGGYPPPPPAGYGYPHPPSYGVYPPPPPPQGYGYGYQPQPEYGYPAVHRPPKNNNFGLGVGAGLLGGLLVGDMISDVGDCGFDGGFDF